MSAVLIVALVILLVSPIVGFFVAAWSLRSSLRRLNVRSVRFRSVLWITLLLTLAQLVLAGLLYWGGLTSIWWSLPTLLILCAMFVLLIQRYERISIGRAAGAFALATVIGGVGSAALVILLVLPLRLFVASPFEVNGESMSPAFQAGDLLLVDKITYRHREPQRGDVVIYVPPAKPGYYYIHRIVGLPGERVVMRDGEVSIAGAENAPKTLDEPYLSSPAPTPGDEPEVTEVTLPSDSYYLLGDNRAHANDSRYLGSVPRDHIIGLVSLRIWPQR
jgi:signal peptidase I